VRSVTFIVLALGLLAAPATLEAEESPVALVFGARELGSVDAEAYVWRAEVKSRSHFGFDGDGSRGQEIKYVENLGLTMPPVTPGGRLEVGLGRVGWIGGELFGFTLGPQRFAIGEQLIARKTFLEPGDVVRSSAQVLLGRLRFGYQVDATFQVEEVPVSISFSPIVELGFFEVAVKLARLEPSPRDGLGGRATGWCVAPGGRVEVVVDDAFVVGTDLAVGLPGLANVLSFSRSKVELWDRFRVYGGLRLGQLELTVGWRLAATHVVGQAASTDMRLRGVDVGLGVRF
jgi:hypothetical protein